MKEDTQKQENSAERKFKSPLLQELQERGFLKDCNDYDKLDEKLQKNELLTCYAGFDLTGKGLHAGHLMILMMMRCFLRHGHNVIALLGGGTTKIGDPSGKDKTRQILTADEIAINKSGIQEDIESILDKDGKFQPDANSPTNNNIEESSESDESNVEHDEIAQKYINQYPKGKAPKRGNVIIKDNDDWLSEIKYIEFLRDIGQYFSVNKMLSMDSVKTRLDRQQPFSFIEFNYALLQSYDFLQLTNENCTIQLGGSDQWGNIIHGINLIGKVKPNLKVFGITCPLIERSDGKKMGKSEGGSIWINPKLLSTENYYNYFYNLPDENIEKFSKIFADVTITNNKNAQDYIEEKSKDKEILKQKNTLAINACYIAHKAKKYFLTKIAGDTRHSPHNMHVDISLRNDKETLETKLSEIMIQYKLIPSKREFKQLMSQGAISILFDVGSVRDEKLDIKQDQSLSDILKSFRSFHECKEIKYKKCTQEGESVGEILMFGIKVGKKTIYNVTVSDESAYKIINPRLGKI